MSDASSRQRILIEAIRLFGQRGFAATSVRELAEAASVSKPTLYYYFANKDALFQECVRIQLEGLAGLVDAFVNGQGSPRARLLGFLESYIRLALEHPDAVRLAMFANNFADPTVCELRHFESYHQEQFRIVQLFDQAVAQGELPAGFDGEMAVRAVCGAADNVVMAAVSGSGCLPDAAERIVNLIFGVKPT